MKYFLFTTLLSIVLLTISAIPVSAQTPTPTMEPEILYPQSGQACSNFFMEYNKSSSIGYTAPPPLPSPEHHETVSSLPAFGKLTLVDIKVPNFSYFEKNYLFAIHNLLPQDLLDNFSVNDDRLTAKVKSFIYGKDGTGQFVVPPEPNKIPEAKTTLPVWWTKLLGYTKILCGLSGTCPAPKSPKIKVLKPKTGAFKSDNCPVGNFPNQDNLDKEQTQPEFATSSLWKTIIDALCDVFSQICTKKTTEAVTLLTKTGSSIPGVATLNKQSMEGLLPDEIIPNGNAPLAGDSSYNVDPGEYSLKEGAEKINYQGLKKYQLSACEHICSLYPTTDISLVTNGVCQSCVFPTGFDQLGPEDIPLVQEDCNRDAQGACDYQRTGDGSRCDGDPICESGKCYPYMYRQAKDYTDHGCSVPYAAIAPDCFDTAVCQKMTFESNSQGGFGACQYQNPQVCVRTDREEIGLCAAMCNWVCCVGQ